MKILLLGSLLCLLPCGGMAQSMMADSVFNDTEKSVYVNLDFINGVTVKEFCGVFATYLKVSFSVDNSLNGIVSLSVMDQKMTRAQIWRLLDRVLWMNGAYIVEDAGVIWVRPHSKMATERATRISKRFKSIDNTELRVFTLVNTEVEEMEKLLEKLVTKHAVISHIGNRKLVISDDKVNLERIAEFIREIDLPKNRKTVQPTTDSQQKHEISTPLGNKDM